MRSPRVQRRHGAHFLAGRHGMHALPDHALARLQALGQRDRAGVVAQHLHAAQFQRVLLRLDHPDGGVLAVMEQRGGRQRVGRRAIGAGVAEADVGRHAQADLGLGIFQRELGAVGAALRVGGGRDLAQHGVESLAGQRTERDAGALAHRQAGQQAFGHVADGVDVARPGQVVDRLAGRDVLARVGPLGGDHAGVVGLQGGVFELVGGQRRLLRGWSRCASAEA